MDTGTDMDERYAMASAILDPHAVVGDILVGDISASMDERSFEPGKSKRVVVGEALRIFVDMKRQHRPQDFVAIIAYSTTASVCCPLLNVERDYRQILDALNFMDRLPTGGTEMFTGLREALDIAGDGLGRRILATGMVRCLAYSDGYDGARWRAEKRARKLRRKGALIETFGVGRNPSDVDEPFLRNIATKSDGFIHYRFLGDATTLRETFTRLASGALTFGGPGAS